MMNIIKENEFRTRKGTPIRRFKGLVGKAIGGQLYVHKNYAAEVIPTDIIEYGEDILKRFDPNFKYNCLMLDLGRDELRFDESPDFDKAREPHVGSFIKIDLKGENPPYKGYSNSIWHHKWLWVRDDYVGFDVDKAKNWSKLWLSKLEEPAKGTDASWKPQLSRHGLIEGEGLTDQEQSWFNKWIRSNMIRDENGNPVMHRIWFKNVLNPLLRKMGWVIATKVDDNGKVVGYTVRKNMVNEQLLMEERAKPKDLEAFLRAQILGSEWEGKVFLVGGFVRDELLGKEPKDADIVVGKFQGGVEFNTWLAKKLNIYKPESNPLIFPTFGTSNLRLDGVKWNGIDFTGEAVDAVMFRKDQYHDDESRKSVTVVYTPFIEVDASRRDITFNAIYKDIATGKILDPTGRGITDLRAGIVRTPIDPTIIYTDDALRMYRAVRFAAQLGFELAPEVVEGIKNNLHRLGNTSRERVRDELNKILLSKNPARGIRMLRDVGLLPYVGKELQQMIGMMQNKWHSDDVFDHVMSVISKTKPTLIARLGALLHDVGKVATRQVIDHEVHFYDHENVGSEIAREIMISLKYPNNIIEPVVLAIKNHMRLKGAGKEGEVISDKKLRQFVSDMGEHLDDVMDIIAADNESHAPTAVMPLQVPNLLKRIDTLRASIPKKDEKLPVTGNDLLQLGLKPGPLIGKLLALVKDKRMETPETTKDEYLVMIKQYLENNKI